MSSYDDAGNESEFSSEISILCGGCLESGGSINGPRVISQMPDKDQTEPVDTIFITFNEMINQDSFTREDIQILDPFDVIIVHNAPIHISDNTYKIVFPPQSDIGTYHVYIGPDIENNIGLLMNQNRNCDQGEENDDRYDASFTIVKKIYGPKIISHIPSGDQIEPVSEVIFTFNSEILHSSLTKDDILFYGPTGNLPVRSDPQRISENTYAFKFDKQAVHGEYHVLIGPDIQDSNNEWMDQDRDGIQNEPIEDRYDACFTIVDNSGPQVVGYTPSHNVKPPLDYVDVLFNEPIDSNTFTNDDIQAKDLNGLTVLTSLEQLKDNVYRISFPSQNQEGSLTIVLDSEIQDKSGNLMDQDLDGKNHQSYFWRVRYFDNHNLSSSWSTPYSFTTEETQYDLSPQNGVPDNQEITDKDVDLNNDSISDMEQINSSYKCLNLLNNNVQLGLGIKGTNDSRIEYFSSLKKIHLSDYLPNVHSYNESIGFKAVGQSTGNSLTATIYFSQPLNANSTWYTYYQNKWNSIEKNSIIVDKHSISFNIQDGSFGDFDGIENGKIIHYGCIGWTIQQTTTPSSDSGEGGGCYISLVSFKSQKNIIVFFIMRWNYLCLLFNMV